MESRDSCPSSNDEYAAVSKIIDVDWYMRQCELQFNSGDHAASHYLKDGHCRDLSPHPLFAPEWYKRTYQDVTDGSMSSFGHYLLIGSFCDFCPHPLFDPLLYKAQGGLTQPNPLIDYLEYPNNWMRKPHHLFDGVWYTERYLDGASESVNPLLHFILYGANKKHDPCPLFNTTWYVSRNPDLEALKINPLVDFVDRRDFKACDPNPFFFSEWYLLSNGDVAAGRQNPLSHYISAGWQEGREPNPYFDAAWYRARHPEVDALKVDPLTHYIALGGAAKGYPTRPADRHTHDCNALDIPYEVVRDSTNLSGSNVCVFVCYAAEGVVPDYVIRQLEFYRAFSFNIVLVVSTDGISNPISERLHFVDCILIRTNHGWDFAAWATALAVFPEIWQADLVLLTNDSVYGPVDASSFDYTLKSIQSSDCDLVALTDSFQNNHHLMSYFTAITRSGLRKSAVRAFWNGVRSNRSKQTVIKEYELRSLERWNSLGVSWDVLFPAVETADSPINPTLSGWKELLKMGSPFIKVQLLRDFDRQFGAEEWRNFCPDADLISIIEADLERRRNAVVVPFRPVPSPKQRFVQAHSAFTYYGALTSVRPHDETDLALEIPFRALADVPLAPSTRVACIVHIYYVDLVNSIFSYICNMPTDVSIFISTDSPEKRTLIIAELEKLSLEAADIRIFPNVGRNIAPLLLGFSDVFEDFDFVLHLHSKKSPHGSEFKGWLDYLLDNLVGSKEIVASILHMLTAHDVGLVFPQHYQPVRNLVNFGFNYAMLDSLLQAVDVEISQDLVLDFPSGSCFWIRSDALRPLLQLKLDWSCFAEEAGQVDGTLAHAFERSFAFVTERVGLRWVKVGRQWQVPFETLVPVHGAEGVGEAIARVHRPLLGNRIVSPFDALLVSETKPLLFRPDPCERPRLTIFIPTLQPAKRFGGLTTALRFFSELGARLPQNVDLRIVSISEPVDLICMLDFPEYRLLSCSSISDAFPRVVVDASELQRGYLGLRRNEIFIATSWWTASASLEALRNQRVFFERRLPFIYLIQDHEPNFYSWSSRFSEAQDTYAHRFDMIAVINSEELCNFLVERYKLWHVYCIPFSINGEICRHLAQRQRSRTILIYGRPSVDRNCFETLIKALSLWQKREPALASRWKIISVGEAYNARTVPLRNLEVQGKLSLPDYAHLLSSCSIGVSLMMSPHPSYPPLEMAFAGLHTLTNGFESKDLSLRSANIVSVVPLSPTSLAAALSKAVTEAEAGIGPSRFRTPLKAISTTVPHYDPSQLADHLSRFFPR